ncbi:MAG: sigma-70 family RNA polymerase sigma factor [Polyangiaceae bacterium]|nr:sigma-70 family RNA polymerase sigma factor [Polyangiaceae bacterium]
MSVAPTALAEAPPSKRARSVDRAAATHRSDARLRQIFDGQFGFVWRYLRRLGLPEADADDATQQAFLVLSRRLDDVEAGKERAFLCGTALRLASEHRRKQLRRREVGEEQAGDLLADSSARPEVDHERKRARALLDRVLDAMDIELRSVFVLFELEELGSADIAAALGLPVGTVASRLRRARESFQAIVRRLRAAEEHAERCHGDVSDGGTP